MQPKEEMMDERDDHSYSKERIEKKRKKKDRRYYIKEKTETEKRDDQSYMKSR